MWLLREGCARHDLLGDGRYLRHCSVDRVDADEHWAIGMGYPAQAQRCFGEDRHAESIREADQTDKRITFIARLKVELKVAPRRLDAADVPGALVDNLDRKLIEPDPQVVGKWDLARAAVRNKVGGVGDSVRRNEENVLALEGDLDRVCSGSDADVTPTPTATPTSSAIEPPLLVDPGAACARYVETVGDSAEEIESGLLPDPAGFEGSIADRLTLLEGSISVLARDLAASPGLDFAAIEIQLGLVAGAIDQLRLEVSADSKTAALRTLETALSALGAVANMVPDGACDELRA